MSGPVGFRVFTKVKRADPALVEAFRDLPVCNIDDSMNKIAGAHSAIKPLNSVKLLGTAITVKAPIGDNLMFHQAISMAQAGRCDRGGRRRLHRACYLRREHDADSAAEGRPRLPGGRLHP